MAAMALHNSGPYQGGGGSSNPLDIILKHLDSVPNMIFGFVLVVTISFADKTPPSFSQFADTVLGRILALSLIVAVVQFIGWSYGLLTATAYLLIVHSSSRLSSLKSLEGFSDQEFHDAEGSRWFVERVLGERPKEIITDKVNTNAVYSDARSGRR